MGHFSAWQVVSKEFLKYVTIWSWFSKILSGKKLLQGSTIESIQSELAQCKSGNQDAVLTRKELDLCHNELTEEQNSKEQLSRNFQSANGNIKTLQNQLKSEKAENENLRNRIQQLESEKSRIE